MKKLLLLTFIALLSFALLSCNDNTEKPSDVTVAPESDFEYEENADGGITITSYKGDDKTVVIPEKIEGIAVTVIGEHAFEYNNVVETVSMPDTVTNIIHGAFFKAGSLKKVDFSDSLSEIGDGAFLGCNSLSEVSLPKGLKTIGINAFSKCEALQSVTLPGSITEYGAETFSGSGLKFVEIENGVTEICSGMFSCTKIDTVELPDSVEKIGAFAFAYCSELKTIKVGKSLKTVGSQAFVDTKNLKEIVFPASVESIDENAFAGFGPETVKFDGDAPDIIRSDIDIIERSKNLIVYYHKGAKGFGETWNGYKTQVW